MMDVILKAQNEFDDAERSGNREQLSRLLTDDFAAIGPKGFLLDKQAWLGRHAQFRYLALETSELDVRLYDGAAIVRNRQHHRSTYQGKELTADVRVSHTWVRLHKEWQLAGIQFSPLAPD
jgi:hypothetical protein